MKTVITVLVLVLLSACGSFKSMEQLEAEALVTGDWSAVELRERQIARRNPFRALQCPPGEVGYCEANFGQHACTCVDQEKLRHFLTY